MKSQTKPAASNSRRSARPHEPRNWYSDLASLAAAGYAIDDVNDVEWETVRSDRGGLVQRATIRVQHLNGTGDGSDTGLVVDAIRRFSAPRFVNRDASASQKPPRVAISL